MRRLSAVACVSGILPCLAVGSVPGTAEGQTHGHHAPAVVDRIVGRWREPPAQVPTKNVPDGPLLGNGRFGAVLTWNVEEEALVEFHFGHNGFFAAPTNGISSCGYLPGGRKALGGLALRFHAGPQAGEASGASAASAASTAAVAEQRPRDATATVLLQTAAGLVAVRSLVQAQEDVLLVDLEADSQVQVTATLWTYSGCSGPPKPLKGTTSHARGDEEVSLGTGPTTDRLHTEGSASLKGIRISRANGWPYQSGRFDVEWFSLSARANIRFAEAGVYPTCHAERGPCAAATFQISGAKPALLSVDLTRNRLVDRLPELAPERSEAEIYRLRTEHRQHWDEFWARSAIELPTSPVTEFYWYMSQYLLRAAAGAGSGVDEGGEAGGGGGRAREAPGLFGPFVMDDDVGWLGDLTLNYNAEATYYGAASSNHLAAFESYIETILDFVPSAQMSARQQVPDCDGALHFPGHILPRGVTGNGKGDMGQKQMALFAAVPFVLYWQHSRDLAFAQRALPFMKGVARFWECSLRAGDDARLHDFADCAEELCIPDGDNQPDPTIVLSLLPAFLGAAADMALALGVVKDVETWQAIAKLIAPYPTLRAPGTPDNKEVIVDFLDGEGDPVAWSGLFATFPLGTVGLSSPPELRSLVHRSLERFFLFWPGGKQGNSFPHAFAAGAKAGWDAERLFGMWEAYLLNTSDPQCRLYPNGMVLGCGGTGLENVGATAYVNEMLLQSHEGVLRLFPTLPAAALGSSGARFHRLRAVGGFLVSASMDASGLVTEAVIESPSRETSSGSPRSMPSHCVVASPWEGDVLVNGETHQVHGGLLRIAVLASRTYRLHPAAQQAPPERRAPAAAERPTPIQLEVEAAGDAQFKEMTRDAECDKQAPGVGAAQFTLGGGGHTLEHCQRACRGAADCSFLTFFTETGYCHMFARCERGTPAPGGAVIYARVRG